MITHSHKAKQYLLIALKVFILAVTMSYIYVKISHHDALDMHKFRFQVFSKDKMSFYSILIFLSLASVNWFFEILKWKTVVSEITIISFKTALKQSLYALTVSLATPNRIGDYGAKAYFFKKEARKNILLLNFFSNFIQMGVTILFGIIGLVYIIQKFELSFSFSKLYLGVIVLVILIVLGFLFKEQQLVIKGLSISKVLKKINAISCWIKIKTIAFSLIRYFIFSYLFYKLLVFFDVTISISEALPLIFAMYLLVSIVPTIFIFDVVVRGGAAVWIFSLANISELPVISAVLIMWLLNFVIPSILGGYFMFAYKPEKS